MSKAHYLTPLAPQESAFEVRLGTNANQFNQNDVGKFVKFSAESAYALCAAGDPIEGVIESVDTASAAGYSVGAIQNCGRMWVTADGLQATPGTGTIALGDYVVCGSVDALHVAKTGTWGKVCKATNQPGVAVTSADNVVGNINAALAKIAEAQKNAMFAWRVVSLGTGGVGTVGATIVVERVNAS